MKIFTQWSLLAMTGFFLGGCATAPYSGQTGTQPVSPSTATSAKPPVVDVQQTVTPPAPPVVVPVELPPSEKNLAIATASFDRGEYSLAMKQLSPLTTDSALEVADRLKAIKTLAFAQCLTGAVVACRKSFESAFKLDQNFDLAPAEQGHPVWGQQFLRARKVVKTK